MTLADQDVPVIGWNEPDGLIPRGTVIVIPGRGELPTVYERFGRRLAGDAYRVRVVADPVVDAGLARAQISGLLADSSLPAPRVLAGSDTGALFAIMLARSGRSPAVDALLLAGLPATPEAGPAASWEEELNARTTCPTHRGRLTASAVRRGALYEPIPSYCSWNGSGRTAARARLRCRSSWDNDERAQRRRLGARVRGVGHGSLPGSHRPGSSRSGPGPGCAPEPGRSVLHMC